MIRSETKLWTAAAGAIATTIVLVLGTTIFLWQQLSAEEKVFLFRFVKDHFFYFFSCGFILLAGFGLLLDGIIHIYVLPIRKLADEATLISTINPAHRIAAKGAQDVKELTQIINQWGQSYQELQINVNREVENSKAEIEREKNILAAFMAELPEGVLICNAEGRILLYNKKALQLFSRNQTQPSGDHRSETALDEPPRGSEEKIIGLGRSIFRIIDKNLIVHALEEIAEKLHRKEGNAASSFVAVSREDRLLRVEMAPILNSRRQLTGIVLVFFEISEQLEKDSRVTFLLQSLLQGFRASLGSMRSAIETILAYPQMKAEQLEKFRKIIHHESIAMGGLVDEATAEYPKIISTQWPLVSMRANDLIAMVQRRAKERLGIDLNFIDGADKFRVKIDSYSIILAILFLLNQLKQLTGVKDLDCRIEKQDRFVAIDILWRGDSIKIGTLHQWELEALTVGREGLSLTLKEVIRHHEAEIWSYSSPTPTSRPYLRLFLPSVQATEPDISGEITILTEESRPVFYDFDLFTQTDMAPDLGDRLLTELVYTVFDTETTGLNPHAGDEIIAIGAVRIVNGRLLSEELMDQLVDPQREISLQSVKIHGIRPEMVAGQPTIEKVLPAFHRFCENTVIVAHNAAFDMLMLQLKEESTGIRFTNPVLDTLLLSDVLHPAHRRHDMETIAGRLGISIVGRHTALGDALATAEIFLKIIPLLANMGIYTLKDALKASKNSNYARLKY